MSLPDEHRDLTRACEHRPGERVRYERTHFAPRKLPPPALSVIAVGRRVVPRFGRGGRDVGRVGSGLEKKNLLTLSKSPARIPGDAGTVDEFGLAFFLEIRGQRPRRDLMLELVNVCRPSFAVPRIVAPPSGCTCDRSNRKAPCWEVFGGDRQSLLADIGPVGMHDAALSTAIAWKHIQDQVSQLD